MAKKIYPKSQTLAKQFMDTIRSYPGFVQLSQDKDLMAHISIDGEEYFLFFKCVSPEGYPHPIEHQRSQLPSRPEFETAKNSKVPFLFLGYDMDNDLYVCWEPEKVKKRLNKKKYVSFYSRLSIQQQVQEGSISEEALSNGDKFVLFKRQDIIPFFQMIAQHFPELSKEKTNISAEKKVDAKEKEKNGNSDVVGKLKDIEDDYSVKLLVDSLFEKSKLEIVSACMNQFFKYYNKMTLHDWYNVVMHYFEKKETLEE
ncbi:MAG: hypothetical protein ACLR16_15230 [Segatella copri]